MERNSSVPRYEIHMGKMGVACLFIDGEGPHGLHPPLGFRSVGKALAACVGKALAACDRHSRRKLEWQYDAVCAWATIEPPEPAEAPAAAAEIEVAR